MADESLINGEFSDDRAVEITSDDSSKISVLTQKISDLEQENYEILQENKEYKQKIEELKVSVKKLSDENVGLKNQVAEAESENKALGSVAARASVLEIDLSRLQHDMISVTSELQDSKVELSDLKKDLAATKGREKENDVKLDAIEKERNLLLSKVENLEALEINFTEELEKKKKEIDGLKKKVEELEAVVGSSNNLEVLKGDLEKMVEKLKNEIEVLNRSLEEKDKLISGFEVKEKTVVDGVNGGTNGGFVYPDGKKGFIGDLKKKDWAVVAGSTVAAIAVMGGVCYIRHTKKQ